MNTTRTMAQATVSHRLATALRVGRFLVGHGFETLTPNGRLISHRLAAGFPPANRAFQRRESVAVCSRLNAFFAISVNSPSMSMVNFSCCVGSAQKPYVRGVTRRVTPQPMRAALRME